MENATKLGVDPAVHQFQEAEFSQLVEDAHVGAMGGRCLTLLDSKWR